MPGISSLLRSAQATKKKIQSQNDAYAAFEWENSAQTYEDFLDYSKYLDESASKSGDPSDQLTYQTKIRAARRSYVSNELQRQQMAIMEGRATTQDKMNAVQNLFYQAQDNGDFNLAQNLLSQWEALSIKAQGEKEAAVKAFAAAGNKAVEDLTRDLTKGFDDVRLPNGETVTPLAAIARDMETTGGSTATWEAAQDTLEALRGVVIDQYNNATTQEQVDKLEEKYGPGLADLDKELYFNVGGKKLSAQDVVNAAANEGFNNPLYGLKAVRNEATGETEYKLTENNIERIDYVRQIDEQGNEYYAPASIRTDQSSLMFGQSDQGRGLNTQITDSGEIIGGNVGGDKQQARGNINAGEGQIARDDSLSIGNRLKNLGIIAKQNGTTLTIKLPGENVEREAIIQPDGSIRYFSDDGQMVEFGLTDRNLGTELLPQVYRAGEQRLVSPEEVSDFGTASAFGGTLSQSSGQGKRYLNDITGKSPVATVDGPLKGNIRAGNDFGGFGTAVTSGLLQGGAATRSQIQQEAQRQQMLQAQTEATARIQASQTFNLNQVPVQQLTGSGILKRQLQVAAPAAQPRLYVAPPVAAPQITNVGVARPNSNVSVGAPLPVRRAVVR